MFVKDTDLINIKIYYKKDQYLYIAHSEKEFADLEIEEEKNTFKEVNVKMKELTWGLFNTLQEEAMVDVGSGERSFNFKIYKENRLKKLIKEWDAKDAEEKPVPVSDKNIASLAPPIAETILRAYDETSFVTEGEEKNL